MQTNRAESLLTFLDDSPCNFLAVNTIKNELLSNGFIELDASDKWNLAKGGKYFVIKNDSAIFGFTIGDKLVSESGFKIISAHSDSPCFRIKPNPEMTGDGVLRLNTEVYGGPILYTWFDRPLSVAGRVIVKNPDNPLKPTTMLINMKRPVMVIPHLAIHFNRGVNEGNKLSRQKDMLPIATIINENAEKDEFLINQVAKELNIDKNSILDFDLILYNHQKAEKVGFNEEFICSGRIDDLSMAHAALCALVDGTDTNSTKIMAIFDNEETGKLDKLLIDKAINIVKENIASLDFDVNELARAMNMSRSTLTRKLKAITGDTPLYFIRHIKMKQAKALLNNKSSNISEVATALGYQNRKYFTACFKEEFGITPSEYQKNHSSASTEDTQAEKDAIQDE